jgi:TolB-like protein/class 3 adenylate cyclase
MAADVAGYSRMMEVDEAGTLARMQALLAAPIGSTVAAHRGRIVKTAGDGVLVEFPSIIEAVQCAVEIQQSLRKLAEGEPPALQFRLRIGINFGDVIVEAADIHGSGVNIAARLEALAEPGGICVTQAVRDQIVGKLPIVFRDVGFQALKNIASPLHVFIIEGDASAQVAIGAAPSSSGDKPSVAILPFVNMSGAAEQTPFCDGITEDIITELSRFRTLSVISRNSSFQFRDNQQDIRRIGRELAARYVLEGSVRIAGARVRITGQLIDASTGVHVWANRYDREMSDIFATQDAISQEIVSAITLRLEDERLEQTRTKPPENISAYEWWLKGKRAFYSYEHDGMMEAQKAFEKAIEADPGYARAIAYLAFTHNMATSYFGWGVSLDEPHELAVTLARKAAQLDPTDHMAEQVLGWCEMFRRQFGGAKRHFDRSQALNPNDVDALLIHAWYQGYTGQHAAAEATLKKVRQLDPMLPSNFLGTLVAMRVLSGRYEEAIAEAVELSRDPWPEFPGWLAIANAHLDRIAEAKALGEAFRRNVRERWRGDPKAGDKDFVKWFFLDNPIQDQADIDRFTEGFRLAGLEV